MRPDPDRAPPRVRLFGDGALLVDAGSVRDAHRLAITIDAQRPRWPGLEDVVVGFGSVTVVLDPVAGDLDAVVGELSRLTGDLAGHLDASGATGAPGASAADPAGGRAEDRRGLVQIPVAFDGPDLDEVARIAGVEAGDVVDLLGGAVLEVVLVGFAPGFAYLGGLPGALARVPRRTRPRPAVPAGSVALGGGFAGVYPMRTPGGWQVVGHSAMALFDAETPPFAALRWGDRVRLCPSSAPQLLPQRVRAPLRSHSVRRVVVEEPGLLCLVQDAGRIGAAAMGVPRAGAADPYTARLANRLVGNPDDAAVLEVTGRGPTLVLHAPAYVAAVGVSELSVDGLAVPVAAVVPVGAGQRLKLGTVGGGLRAYLGVDGGFDVPALLGSRSSDVLCGLGPGPLAVGDELGLGASGRPHGRLVDVTRRAGPATPASGVAEPARATLRTLRVLAGPDEGTDFDALVASHWEVESDSDRVGVRLRRVGDRLSPSAQRASGARASEITSDAAGSPRSSRGVVTGAVQMPPDGSPIVLLCDHATLGGYPLVATVVSADWGELGQCRPGDAVCFHPVDPSGARRARHERERALDESVVGWYPVRAD